MTKSELIDVITSVNRSATREFLAEFSNRDLVDYMRQLEGLGLIPRELEQSDPTNTASGRSSVQ
jgi:hypothetical protein